MKSVYLSFLVFLAGAACQQQNGMQSAVQSLTSALPTMSLAPTVVFPDVPVRTRTEADATVTGINWTYAVSAVQANSLSYVVPNDPDNNMKALCWYPVSGTYGDLTRWLFYVTIVFALVARTHQWLVIGALGASLTYSASTAVHALVLMWSGRPSPNPDLWAALGILSFSAALAVPLLNWSSTVKNMGKDREEDSVGRTVVVYWSCLIFFAFLNLWGGLIYRHIQQSRGLMSGDFFAIKAYSSSQDVTCSPSSGILDLTAGQQSGWDSLYITQDFVDSNNCVNPCNEISDRYFNVLNPILRAPKDLQLLTAKQVNLFQVQWNLPAVQKREFTLFTLATSLGLLSLVWTVAQALAIVLFGRRNPSQIRNFVYVKLAKMLAMKRKRRAAYPGPTGELELNEAWSFNPDKHPTASFFAKSIAIIGYLWAWSASIVAVLIAIGAMICTEYILYELPQSDLNFEIDQWGAWAATGLVILAAFAYRFQGITEDVIVRSVNQFMSWIYRCIHGHQFQLERNQSLRPESESNRRLVWENFKYSIERKTKNARQSFVIMTENEWKENMDFLKDAWQTAVHRQGTAHQRRRRVIASEMQEIPEGWQGDRGSWLELEQFISAVREFDKKHREKCGKGFLWQPRVTEEAPLRRKFDTELLKGIFVGRGDKTTELQPYTQLTDLETSARTADPTGLADEMAHVPLTDEPRRSFTSDTTAVPESNRTLFPTTTTTTSPSSSPALSGLVRVGSESPPQAPPRTVLVTDIPPARSSASPLHRRSPALSPDSAAAPLRDLMATPPIAQTPPTTHASPDRHVSRHARHPSSGSESLDGQPLLAELPVDPVSRPRREPSLASMPSLEIVIPSPEIVFEDENGVMTRTPGAGASAGVNNPFRQPRQGHRRTTADVEETLSMLSPIPHSPLD